MEETGLPDVAEFRKHYGLSISEFAKLSGLNMMTVRLYELGKRMPYTKTLRKMVEFMQRFEAAIAEQGVQPETKTVTPKSVIHRTYKAARKV